MAAAAAAIAVLCGAAAIWHYASVSTEETVYHTEDTRTLSDGTEVTYFEDFTSDSIIRIDTEGRTEGTYCGVQFGWLPTALVPDHTAYLYNVIANRNPEQLDGVSDSQIEMAKDCVYSTDSTSQVKYTFSCLSANEIVSCDLLLLLDDPTIVKEGTLNGLYACWIEAYRTDRGSQPLPAALRPGEALPSIFGRRLGSHGENSRKHDHRTDRDPHTGAEPELHLRRRIWLT